MARLKRNRVNLFPSTLLPLFLCLFIFMLGACTGGGYSARPWESSSAQNQSAQQPPRPLSDIYREGRTPDTTADSTQTSADSNMDGRLQDSFQSAQPPALIPPADDGLPPVKVGLLLPLSGQHASLGQAMLKAAQMALFEIGHNRFELVPRDTKGTAQGARDAAQSAIQNGVGLLLGPVFADAVRAVKPVAASARINLIGYSTDWTLAGENTFIMGFLPFDQVERVVNYAASQNIGRVSVLAPNTEYGRSVISAYRSAAGRAALPTTKVEMFSAGSSNLSPTVRNFADYDSRQTQAQQNPGFAPELPFEAVLMPMGGELALSVSNLLTQYDVPPGQVKRLGTGLFDDLGLASEPSLEGAWFAAPSPRQRQSFEQRYFDTYKSSPPRLASLAYDSAALAAVLAQRGLKSGGRAAFDAASISNPNGFSGVDGIFRFRNDGLVERGLAVLEYYRGNIRVIDEAPATFQQAEQKF